MHHEQEVRQIAYQIWEEQGHPQGQELEHWLKAEAAWQEKQAHATPSFQHASAAHKPAGAIQVKEAKTQTQPRPPAR
jgi:hypothetical protein